MSYLSILSLIDVELKRLRAARGVLLDEAPAVRAASETMEWNGVGRSRLAEAQAGPETIVEATPQPDAPAAGVVAQALPPRRRRAYAARRAKAAPAEPRALAGAIPQGPVAVSAGALASQRAARAEDTAAAADAAGFTPSEGGLDSLLRDLQARANGALSAS